MDDDIEIEEHDILEHPLVKAVFPDLSRIKIQVLTEADDPSLLHNKECNLFDDLPNFIEDKKINGEEFRNGEENKHEEEFLDPLQDEGNLNNSYKYLPNHINKTVNRQVDEVHEISDDEPMAEVTEENDTNEANEGETTVKQYIVNFKSRNAIEIVNYVEISDDEEPNKRINGHNSKNSTAKDGNVDATDIDEFTTAIEIAKDDETQENGYDHSDNENSDTEKNSDANEICMIDNESVAMEVSDDETNENREVIVNGQDENDVGVNDDLLDEILNSPLESIQESEKSLVLNENTLHENVHKANQMVNDEYIPSDLLDEDENRPRIVEADDDSVGDGQNGVDEMDTEVSDEAYIGGPIKQEIEDVPIKEEINDFSEEYNFDDSVSEMGMNFNVSPTFDESEEYIPNRIIIGSKPSPTIRPHVNTYSFLIVRLEDWGKRLNESTCYCSECKILFTTPNDIDYHNMSAHSLLSPITNRAIKSTAKINKPNIAKKSTGSADLDKSTHCSHCNVNFKDNKALIKHLYELLPQQYNCNLCSKTFNSQNDLANHSSAVHVKKEPRKILKAKKKLDNPMLRSLLTEKPKTPVRIKSEPVDESGYKFKCMVCSDILSNYQLARKHREIHPEKKKQMLFKKIISGSKLKRTNDKLVFENDSVKKHKLAKVPLSSEFDSEAQVALVPMSALFQCPKCHLHFTSSTSGMGHMSRSKCDLKSTHRIWTCPTCKKKFRVKDREIHKKQHQISSKLKIYKLTKSSHEKTLYKCSKCNVHFEYIWFKMHMQNCGKIPTAKCKKCNILLMQNKMLNHMSKHYILKLKPKDFIFVEFMIMNVKSKKINQVKSTEPAIPTSSDVDITKPLTVKTKPGSELTQKFLKVDQYDKTGPKKYKMYFCNNCNTCLTYVRKPENHLGKKCSVNHKQTFVCYKCGLFLPWNTKEAHARLHQQKNLSITEIQFLDLATRKPIATPIMPYASCPTCKIHFLTNGNKRKHVCGEDYENCEYCGDMFEISLLKVHRQFHLARQLINKPKTDKSKPETSESVIPELMMRYESLNPTWNILFICSKCDLITDLYNKAVEHSQDHLRKGYKQPKSITCYICDFVFDETCWAKHKELHTQKSINRKAFNLLTYTPENLLEESWFKMFESVPEKEIRQIIDQSVFGGERSLKMKLIKYGLPEFTLYCCNNCQVCYDTNNITAHVNVKCKGSKHRCSECEMAFENESTLTFHKMLHEKGIRREEFRIINFMKTTQTAKTNSDKNHAGSSKMQETEVTLSKINEKVDPRALKVLMEVRERVCNDEIDLDKPVELKTRAKFSMYRCIKCSACIHMKIYRNKHKCAPVHELHFCTICKQNVHTRRKGNHNAKHVSNPNFRPKNTNVFEFDLKEVNQLTLKENYKQSTKKYKKLKVVSTKTKKIHKKVVAKNSNPRKAKRANSVESFGNFVKTITSDVKTEALNLTKESYIGQGHRRSFKIFKCDCGLHFTSLKTIDKHMETCNNGVEISTDNCSKCGLLFPTEILVTHLCKHHVETNPDITVEEIKKNKSDSSETRTSGAKNKNYAGETDSTESKTDRTNSSETENSGAKKINNATAMDNTESKTNSSETENSGASKKNNATAIDNTETKTNSGETENSGAKNKNNARAIDNTESKTNSRETKNSGAKNKNNARAMDDTEIKTNQTNSSDDISTEVKAKSKPKDYVKIYKCGECQVHYLNQNTCYKHAYYHHVKLDPIQFIDCKVCGLAFTLPTLQAHITKHHKTDLDLEKVLVEEYHPGEGRKALKIDIYFASEKVQNVQVSSTND